MVAQHLIGKAIRSYFLQFFPDPSKLKKKKNAVSPYQPILDWFSSNDEMDLLLSAEELDYKVSLESITGLGDIVDQYMPKLENTERYVAMEFLLHALAEHSQIGKAMLERSVQFKDLFGSMFTSKELDMEEGM
jgi:magnesium chelatase subunit I